MSKLSSVRIERCRNVRLDFARHEWLYRTGRRIFLGIAAVLLATPAIAAGLGEGEDVSIPWLRIALSLLACTGVAWGAIMLLRRHQAGGSLFSTRFALPRAPERAIGVIETRRVSQHGDACLLRCRGKAYLLLVTPHQVAVLDSFAEGAE